MSNSDNPVAWFLGVGITFGLLGWVTFTLTDQLSSKLIKGVENQIENKSEKVSFTILGDTFSGYSTFRSAAFQTAVEEVGLSLRYEDEFDQAKRAQRLNKGEADLLVTTLDQFLKQKPEGKIVGLIDRTVGADAVVLNTKKYPNLKSLMDLTQLVLQAQEKGQQLGITFAGETPSEYLLELIVSSKFEAFKLSNFQITKVQDASDAWKLLQDPNQNIAVAVIWEPFVSQARQKGYKAILSSKDAPQAIVDVVVASNRLIQSQPEKISELLGVYYRHIDVSVRKPSQLQAQIAADGKLSATDAAAVLQGIEFFTSVEAQKWFLDGTLDKRIRSTAAVLTLTGKLNQVPQNPKDLYTSEFIAKATTNKQKLIDLVRADNLELTQKLESKTEKTFASTVDADKIKTAPGIGNLQVQGEIKFATNSSELTDEGKQTLNKLAERIAEFNEKTVAVRVIGHTSKFGDVNINQTISKQRVEAVANYLRSRGLKHKIVAVREGSSRALPSVAAKDQRNQPTAIHLVRVN